MLKILTVGFDSNELTPTEDFVYAVHKPGVTEGMTSKEYLLKCKSMVSDADVLVVKSDAKMLAEDEVVLIYTAYTTFTPIFVVGDYVLSPLLEISTSNRFKTSEELLDHLKVFYSNRIIV